MHSVLEALTTSEGWIALLTLAAMEIVLGVDNVVFLAIIAGKLPVEMRARARLVGLMLAMVMRIGLLLSIKWIMGLTEPALTVLSKGFSGRDVILLVGGLFLIGKATMEIHDKVEGVEHGPDAGKGMKPPSFAAAIGQIVVIDIVFSLDSVITAVGMAKDVGIMIIAMVAAVIIMMIFAGAVSGFVERNPTVKMLALSFLLLIGVMLVVEGWGGHVDKGYIYFAMAFSLGVEVLNLRARKKSVPSAGGAAHG